jgi:hypothetical protein
MHILTAFLALGALVAMPGWAPAAEPDDEPTAHEIVRDQIEALHDLEEAETDEEADAAQKRFDDAAGREVQERQKKIDRLLEK